MPKAGWFSRIVKVAFAKAQSDSQPPNPAFNWRDASGESHLTIFMPKQGKISFFLEIKSLVVFKYSKPVSYHDCIVSTLKSSPSPTFLI